jgi:hypothetical protein
MSTKDFIPLPEAAKLLPGGISGCTLWRWCTKGFYIRALGKIIRLEHAYAGRRLFTTGQWLDQFIGDLTAARALERERRSGKGVGRKWERLLQLYEADAVLRRAGI